MSCPVSSNRQRKTKKSGRRWASAKPSGKKTKTKQQQKPSWRQNHLCVEAVFFFQMNLEYPGSIPNLNHEKQFSHFGTLWVAPGFGPPYPTDATQHHGGDRRPTVRPLEKGQLLVTSSVCFYECGSFWWCDNRIQTLAAKKEHPGVSPKPCFSQINFRLNSECLELDVSQLTRPQRTFLTAGSGFRAEMIRYCYPNKTCFQWKVVWNYHYATVRSLLLAVSSPLFEQCSNAHPKRSKLPSREHFWHPGIFCLASRDGVVFNDFDKWWHARVHAHVQQVLSCFFAGRWAWVSLSDLYLKWITACRDCLLLLYSMSQGEFR